jgi:hypothetical protein
MIVAEHKRSKEMDVSFKKKHIVCDCGNNMDKTVLVIDGYGFDDVKCDKCGKRHFITVEDAEGEY